MYFFVVSDEKIRAEARLLRSETATFPATTFVAAENFFMPYFSLRTIFVAAHCALLALAAGCQSAERNPAPRPEKSFSQEAESPGYTVSAQLIVKFRDGGDGGLRCDPAGVARLALLTGVTLQFSRQMSGNACVVMQRARDADGLAHGQEILKQHPSTEWVEVEAVMKRF